MKSINQICVIGMGYVGAPLALELAKTYKVIGYDIDETKINNLSKSIDTNNEIESSLFQEVHKNILFSHKESSLENSDLYIVTVPTPINEEKEPDLSPLIGASNLIGGYIKKDNIVVYESTVFPGCTEEICGEILEKVSGLKINIDFYLGYSPERINPGDKLNNVRTITKVISASSNYALDIIDTVYLSVVDAGTFRAPNIRTAEMSKVIENTQRDLNIALINEISIICRKIGINTNDVLNAAGTKWNFLKFKPGLVGGHCIGVDPYYLTYKASELNHDAKVILAGRELNDNFANLCAKEIEEKFKNLYGDLTNVLFLGCSFKEDVSDVRNSKVFDMIQHFIDNKVEVECYDPVVDVDCVYNEYSIKILEELPKKPYDIVILSVPHKAFVEMGLTKIKSLCKEKSLLADLKGIFQSSEVDYQL
ncbi:nucleotide sugar dehydrogenase [Gammaproteobacteria bacterium]|nr:nucleotide sugar dehydrogenase [Gammaproteobacteria bacterium]